MATAHRGSIAHCLGDPTDAADHFECFEDGLLLVDQGKVAALGPAADLLGSLGSDVEVVDHGRNLIVPGFIDTHVHYPQVDVIASYGTQLLDWLEN